MTFHRLLDRLVPPVPYYVDDLGFGVDRADLLYELRTEQRGLVPYYLLGLWQFEHVLVWIEYANISRSRKRKRWMTKNDIRQVE